MPRITPRSYGGRAGGSTGLEGVAVHPRRPRSSVRYPGAGSGVAAGTTGAGTACPFPWERPRCPCVSVPYPPGYGRNRFPIRGLKPREGRHDAGARTSWSGILWLKNTVDASVVALWRNRDRKRALAHGSRNVSTMSAPTHTRTAGFRASSRRRAARPCAARTAAATRESSPAVTRTRSAGRARRTARGSPGAGRPARRARESTARSPRAR